MTGPVTTQEHSATIVCQSATDPWPVAPGSAAAVVFSPPYNAGIDYDGDASGDQMPWDEYEWMAFGVMHQASVALMDGGRCWVNVVPTVPAGRTSAGRVSLQQVWIDAASDAGLNYRDTVAWTTPGKGPGCAWGSYQTPSAPNLRGEWEAVLVFHAGPWERETPPEFKGWEDGEGQWPRLASNVWTIQPEADRTHPAPFPVELPRRCIRLSSWPGELIIDPFAGSGTTLVAAQQLGRRALGIERSAEYVRRAELRIGQLSLFGALDAPGGAS